MHRHGTTTTTKGAGKQTLVYIFPEYGVVEIKRSEIVLRANSSTFVARTRTDVVLDGAIVDRHLRITGHPNGRGGVICRIIVYPRIGNNRRGIYPSAHIQGPERRVVKFHPLQHQLTVGCRAIKQPFRCCGTIHLQVFNCQGFISGTGDTESPCIPHLIPSVDRNVDGRHRKRYLTKYKAV